MGFLLANLLFTGHSGRTVFSAVLIQAYAFGSTQNNYNDFYNRPTFTMAHFQAACLNPTYCSYSWRVFHRGGLPVQRSIPSL